MKATGMLIRALCAAAALAAAPADAGGEGPSSARDGGKHPAAPTPLSPERVEIVRVRGTPPPAVRRMAPPPSAAAKAGFADPREVFARANSLYEGGAYKEAASEYEKLVEDGYAGGNLYYNLGNACLKLDRKGKAILYYKKALLLLPRDQDVKTNLEYAFSLVEDRLAPRQKPWCARRWDTVVGWFTLREWRIAAAAIFWGLCAVLIALIYAPGARQVFSRAAMVAAVLFAVSAAAAFSRAYLDGQEQAVILSREAKVRYGPSEKDVIAFILHEGAVVELENEKGDWCQVSLPDGKAGWVEKRQCGII